MNRVRSELPLGILLSAISYTVIFYLNNWLASELSYGLGVNWIYLPAGLRLFLTLIFGLPGAIGIALASFLICYFGEFPPELVTCIGVGLISGFAPYLAKIFVLTNIKISPDLSDLSLPKLAACILIYAVLSAGLHQWWFAIRGLEDAGALNHFLVMFLGDVLGTVLLIGIIKLGLNYLKSAKAS
ncbi:MAG: hypothetical protein B7Y05_16700 [Polynucleobacter sp. 24-46-87]|jgi:hypothetical protein|nr:MAG: hypothetical protein B7Y55_03020 [Polynucleobacter sp. 35-46-207]OZA10561.1 MAG: hypothetical protein B7Y05_16700 [Polynucleobacter sp. 24-46-87]OZA39067.1 MAG: hypothetical protein B7X83_05155 [Polynucleobacter sp. 17-46-58]OZB48068.1 MAG: hypothetical protein B7X60_04770 [Polynucleobacter sp. 39-45-136]